MFELVQLLCLKVSKMSVALGGDELSKFSDTPGDASLDDLFQPLDKHSGDQATGASTSLSILQSNMGNVPVNDVGKNDLATKLRATIAQKQMENEMGQASGGGDLIRLVMGVLKDDDIDIDGLVRMLQYNTSISILLLLIASTTDSLVIYLIRFLMRSCPEKHFFLCRYFVLLTLGSPFILILQNVALEFTFQLSFFCLIMFIF